MVNHNLNRREVLKLLGLVGGALAAGVGCSDEVRSQQAVEQPSQQEKILCKAYAEVPVYNVTVQRGDSLGAFHASTGYQAYGHAEIEVPFEIPSTQSREGCFFIDIIDHKRGSNTYGESRNGHYTLDVNDLVAVANGFRVGTSEDELNRRLFHPGKTIKYPLSPLGQEAQKAGSVGIEMTLSMDDVCGKRSANHKYQCELDFKAAVSDPLRETGFKFTYRP